MSRQSLVLAPEPDPCPDLVVERGPKDKGVGAWVPQDKHRLLCDYLHASRYAWKSGRATSSSTRLVARVESKLRVNPSLEKAVR